MSSEPQIKEAVKVGLRDYYAGLALQGLLAGSQRPIPVSEVGVIAGWAYQFADAMLLARDQ